MAHHVVQLLYDKIHINSICCIKSREARPKRKIYIVWTIQNSASHTRIPRRLDLRWSCCGLQQPQFLFLLFKQSLHFLRMSNLISIGFTALAGSCGAFFTLLSFGIATKSQSTYIAARCTARPRTVIYNPNPTDSSQDRGNILWGGWIPWVMKLR
jgi:hypothetical protein